MTNDNALATYRASASEADIQRGIVDGLRAMGYIVLETERYRRKCSCGSYARGSHGTPGQPDLFVSHEAWGNQWLGLECKKPGGRIRPEQAELAARGVTVVVRNWEDAVRAVTGRVKVTS
ncbi:MAG: hypothetical protein JWO59_718 [Chloroflexi bacterium]|nr:hypothetical protein [Chloroflexota bacterium]